MRVRSESVVNSQTTQRERRVPVTDADDGFCLLQRQRGASGREWGGTRGEGCRRESVCRDPGGGSESGVRRAGSRGGSRDLRVSSGEDQGVGLGRVHGRF